MGYRLLLALGFGGIFALIIVYGRLQDPGLLTPAAVSHVQRMAGAFYPALLAALGAVGYGMYLWHRQAAASGSGRLGALAAATWNNRSRKVFVIVAVSYGAFFSLTSGTLVYQPEVSFAYHYGADIPSVVVAPCCDYIGYMPKALAYLTDHVGLQIVPVNLLLQITVSYLVGLNAAVAVQAYKMSKKGSGMGTVGAATGLFIACPTCVGSFLSVFVGTATGIVLSVAIAQLQTVFIAITIPVLVITPFIMATKLVGKKC